MKLIALTGGIASGKSTVARRLVEHGAVHIDADQLARDAVAPGSTGLALIRAEFGEQMVSASGELDRAALGQRVFADPDARKILEGITHPEVRRLAEARIAMAAATDPAAIVVYDVPLLVETGGHRQMPWDAIIVTDAPAETRIERMISLRGMSREDAAARVASQASDAERRAIADIVIDTSGSEQYTLDQVDDLWPRISR